LSKITFAFLPVVSRPGVRGVGGVYDRREKNRLRTNSEGLRGKKNRLMEGRCLLRSGEFGFKKCFRQSDQLKVIFDEGIFFLFLTKYHTAAI
jgi:hypothetical protein